MTMEQISEKKSPPDFLESEKYKALQKEVRESVSLGRADKDMDIAPVFNYFEKELIKNGISEVRAEKLFWQTVAEKIKEIRFKGIYRIIRSEIENSGYQLARRLLAEELNRTIEQLSHTLYANLSRKDEALRVLKEEFYKLFPEIEALIEETEEERRTKIKRPSGQLEEDSYEKWEEEKGKYLVEKLEWTVPAGAELVPGLIVQLLDRENGGLQNFKFLELPRFNEDGDLTVEVDSHYNKLSSEMLGSESIEEIKLVDYGLVADAETGLWNSRYKPLLWEVKKENK